MAARCAALRPDGSASVRDLSLLIVTVWPHAAQRCAWLGRAGSGACSSKAAQQSRREHAGRRRRRPHATGLAPAARTAGGRRVPAHTRPTPAGRPGRGSHSTRARPTASLPSQKFAALSAPRSLSHTFPHATLTHIFPRASSHSLLPPSLPPTLAPFPQRACPLAASALWRVGVWGCEKGRGLSPD